MFGDQSTPEGEQPEAGEPRPRRRWPRRIAIALSILVGLAVALRMVLPTLIERGAAWAAPRYLGLPVRIANADLWLLRGAVALEGLAVGARPEVLLEPAADGTPPAPEGVLLRWDRVFARIEWGALLDRTVRVRELTLDAPAARLERLEGGRIDPLASARPTALQEEAPAPAEPAPADAPVPAPPPTPGAAPPEGQVAPTAEPASEPWAIALERLELRGPDVRLADAASGEQLVEFGLEDLLLENVSVRGEELSLGGLGIRGPVLRVKRDFVMGQGAAPPAEEAPAEPAAAPPGYRVERIGIERAQFTLLTDAGPLDVALGLEAQDVALLEDHRFPLRLSLEIEKARLGLDGQVGILPPSYEGKVTWEGLSFPPLLLAARPELEPWLRSANASGDLQVTARLTAAKGAAPGIELQGRTALADFAAGDPSGKEVSVAWKQLEVAIRKVELPLPEKGEPLRPTRIDLESVRLVAPDLLYTDPAPSLEALLGLRSGEAPAPGGATPQQESAPAAAAAVSVAIGAVEVTEGRLRYESRAEATMQSEIDGLHVVLGDVRVATGAALDAAIASVALAGKRIAFRDENVEPAFASTIRDFTVDARGVRWPERSAESLRARGTAADGGSFLLTGGVRKGSGDVKLELRQLALPPFDPYARSAAGYRVGGAASLVTTVKIRGARYQTSNALTLHDLDVSSDQAGDFEERFGVPLDLALALLRDPAGNISLSIPVDYDEKTGASVGVGSIVAGALRQALVGALTSPLKMLGSLAGGLGGGDGKLRIEPIPSVPGSAELAEGEAEHLEGMAKLLGERPTLALRLRGRSGAADRPVVAEQILIERVQGDLGLPALEGAGFLARRRVSGALAARGKGEDPELDDEQRALLERYVAAVEVPPERLAALSRARAEKVRDASVAAHGLAPERFVIGDPAAEGDPGVVLELTTN